MLSSMGVCEVAVAEDMVRNWAPREGARCRALLAKNIGMCCERDGINLNYRVVPVRDNRCYPSTWWTFCASTPKKGKPSAKGVLVSHYSREENFNVQVPRSPTLPDLG